MLTIFMLISTGKYSASYNMLTKQRHVVIIRDNMQTPRL